MVATSKAGPELGFIREPAPAMAEAVIEGTARDVFQVISGWLLPKGLGTNRCSDARIDVEGVHPELLPRGYELIRLWANDIDG